MKTRNIAAFVLASAIGAPAFAAVDNYSPAGSAAAATQPAGLTRAQVSAELVQLEQAGWRPGQGHTTYPNEIQAAEAKVAAQNGLTNSYGGVVGGLSASGAPTAILSEASSMKSLYSGH